MAKLSTLGSESPVNVDTHAPVAQTPQEKLATYWLKSGLYSWFGVAIAAVLAQVVVSLTFKQPALDRWCAGLNLVLLILAAGVTSVNAVLSSQAIRLFWSFLAVAYWVWALPPCAWFYYSVLHGRVANFLLMTFPWFLHIVLMIAATAVRPHLKLPSRRPYAVTLNFLMVLFLLIFAYAYLLFPYGYGPGFTVVMRRWAAIYSAENLILLIVLGSLVVKSQRPWKIIYGHLLGASALYALASEFAHLVFASSGRFTDGLIAVPFNVATAWFVWVSLVGRKQALELAQAVQLDASDRRHASVLAMMAVVAVPLVGVFELLRPDEPHATRLIRLLIVLISVVLLIVVAFVQDYLSNRELASDVCTANDQLRLAVESGKSVVWDWNVKSGQNCWFGDLRTIFGIQTTTMVGRIEDFQRYVHAEDREQLWKAVDKAMQSHTSYTGEFRIVWPDGTVRHVAATGQCYYAPSGNPERMLGVTVDITERKQTQQELCETEERFRLVANTAPVMIWMCDQVGKVTYQNDRRVAFIGLDQHQYDDSWSAYVHPEDLKDICDAFSWAAKRQLPFSREYRLRCNDGTYRWVLGIASPRVNGDGSFAGFIGCAIDITDQKLAQEALQTIGGRLIEAQEEERARIARELHDDVCQRLAMLSLKIEKAAEHRGGGQLTVAQQLKEIWQQCSSLTGDVQALSHELHPSILDNLGLGAAIRSYCREVAEQNSVVVELSSTLSRSLPQDVSLSVFRVVQEALRNSVKYSGQKHVKVCLQEDSEKLELEVSDQGVGFDVTNTRKSGGLGLVSMAERIYQVNGTLRIDSQPNAGTRIRACVPLAAQSSATTDAPSTSLSSLE